ncbi:MAG: hypothetical protein Q7T31_05400, partial [Dietzia sp.]|nr:hypothetical protein [Dietzia sp.]
MGLPTLTRSSDAGPGPRPGSGPGSRSGSSSGPGAGSGAGTSGGSGSEKLAASPRRPVRRRAARFWNDVLTTPGRMSVFAVAAIV